MQVLVFKMCANYAFLSKKETNGGQTEIGATIDWLKEAGHKVSVLTIERYFKKSTDDVTCYTWDEWFAAQERADVIIAFCGPMNAYGGVISEESLASYRILNTAKRPIFYCLTDTQIRLANVPTWIRGKQKQGKYLELKPEDYSYNAKKIQCLSQVYKPGALKEIFNDELHNFKSVVYFPFETTVFARQGLKAEHFEDAPQTDLIYFGNSRSGKRDQKFFKYYCGHKNLKVDVYGNWDTQKLTSKMPSAGVPNFHGKVDMYTLHGLINKSYAHCYISDTQNEGTIWTTRFYEAILNGTVLFIDRDNDKTMTKMGADGEFFYVDSRDELAQKIGRIKNEPDLRKWCLNYQYSRVKQLESSIVKHVPKFLNKLLTQIEA